MPKTWWRLKILTQTNSGDPKCVSHRLRTQAVNGVGLQRSCLPKKVDACFVRRSVCTVGSKMVR
jgi:hypothetical protein